MLIHPILRGLLPWVQPENMPNWFRGFPVSGTIRNLTELFNLINLNLSRQVLYPQASDLSDFCCLPSDRSIVAFLFTPVASPFSLPVNLPVDSPWPLLLCRRKKSLLLSVTQSFRAFFRTTSSGLSHISSQREGPAHRDPYAMSVLAAGGSENHSGSLSSGFGAA